MAKTLISLGANLGNVRESMQSAKRLLREVFPDASFEFSHLYKTPPVGGPRGQGEFLNAVVAMKSQLTVWQVWEGIKQIENDLGRQRVHRWEARRIDMDVLLHDDTRIWTPRFKVPHPRMCMRSFILEPAVEIASDWIDPVSGWNLLRLRNHLRENLPVWVVSPDRELMEGLRITVGDELKSRSTESTPLVRWSVASPIPDQNEEKVGSAASLTSKSAPLQSQWIRPSLLVAAVSTPDPESVLWEDYSRRWARTLNMESTHPSSGCASLDNSSLSAHQFSLKLQINDSPGDGLERTEGRARSFGELRPSEGELSCFDGPRYLLPADDPEWGAHEILSAIDAMRCPVTCAFSFE